MASDEKVVRLSFKQLSNLSERYGHEDRRGSETRSPAARRREKEDERTAKRNRRPDRQIYQPGRTRINAKKGDDDIVDDPGGPEDDLDTGQTDTYPAADQHGDGVENEDEEVLTSQLSQTSLSGSGGGSDTTEVKPRKRSRRPEMQRYVPKIKLEQQAEQPQSGGAPHIPSTPNTDPEDFPNACKNEGIEAELEQVPGSPQRKVDLKSNNVHMLVTVMNEELDLQTNIKHKGPGAKAVKGSQKHSVRVRNLSEGSEPYNLSDVSHDSLEWDYAAVDTEFVATDVAEPSDAGDPWLQYSHGSLSQQRVGTEGGNADRKKKHDKRSRSDQEPLPPKDLAIDTKDTEENPVRPQRSNHSQQKGRHNQPKVQVPQPQREQRGHNRPRRSSRQEKAENHQDQGLVDDRPKSIGRERNDDHSLSSPTGCHPWNKNVEEERSKPQRCAQEDERNDRTSDHKKGGQDKKGSFSEERQNSRRNKQNMNNEHQTQTHRQNTKSNSKHNNLSNEQKPVQRVNRSEHSEHETPHQPNKQNTPCPGDSVNTHDISDKGSKSDKPNEEDLQHLRQGQRKVWDKQEVGKQRGKNLQRKDSGGEENERTGDSRGSRKRDKRNKPKGEVCSSDRQGEKQEGDKVPERGILKEEPEHKSRPQDLEEREQLVIDKAHVAPAGSQDRVGKDGKKLSLKVTFAHNERQVKMLGDRDSSGERQDRVYGPSHEHVERHENIRGGGRGGGIIRLPSHQESSTHHRQSGQTQSPSLYPVHRSPGTGWAQSPAQGRGRGRGRGGSHRTLYDPNNPTKSTTSGAQPLHFHDPHDPQAYQESYQSSSFSPTDDYYYNYPTQGSVQTVQQSYYDSSEYSSSPQQGDGMFYHYHPAYMESTACADDTYARDPYYHSGYEQDNTGRSRSSNRMKAESLLRDVTPLDNQLANLLSHRIHGDEGLQKVMSLRREVQNKFGQIVLLDPDLSNKHNVEQALWKAAFYQVIEVLRKLAADEDLEDHNKEHLKKHLLDLLEEGVSYYEAMLKNLQNTYSFQLEDFLDHNVLPPETLSRQVKLALLSAQRTMICLGDVARYREQTNRTTNYGKARSWYMKAQQIAPKNGRPYNQLAILALYTRRKLDAVYYYMRSLAASNPFITARESLMSLFDEARKKAELTEKRKQQEKRQQRQEEILKSQDGNRVEVWFASDGSSSMGNEDVNDDLCKLTSIELNRRFVLSFLNVHGKLFTKVGRETFSEASSQMLYEYDMLLQHSPPPIGNVRLLQLVTINMFAVENTTPKEGTMEDNCRSLIQEEAVQLGLEMFGLLVKRSIMLLRQHLSSSDCQVLNEDLRQLIPSVKVWADWMTCHAPLWNPPTHTRDPAIGPVIDAWTLLAELCNVLKEVDITHVKLYNQKKEGCDPVILSEDSMLAGFVPLLSLPQIPVYVHSTVDKEVARDCLRVEKLRTFGDYLCGIEPPLLSYNVETHRYISIHQQGADSPLYSESSNLSTYKDDDVIIESEEVEEELSAEQDGHIGHLRAQRDQLQRRVDERERHLQTRHKVLNSDQNCRLIQLEIRPIFIVPDTNCFIDHFKVLKKLIETKKFTIVIPLVVINELDGLARGSRSHDDHQESKAHVQMVQSQASAAVVYLEEQFESRNSHIRALTSKGSVLDTITFRSEETTEGGNNDDLILSCCLHYCKDKARDFMPKDKETPIKLQREVVLLTDDRNLRLKAYTRNVPVKDIPAFLKWAKVS